MTDLTKATEGGLVRSGPPVPPSPPHPLDGQWFLHSEGTTYGPYTGHQLKDYAAEGRVDGFSQVLALGSDKEWTRAAEEPKLASIFHAAKGPAAPPPISAAPGATVVQVTNTIAPQSVVYVDDGEPYGPKSAGLAIFFSFILCGVGQMYCGRIGKGILMLMLCVLLWFAMLGWIIMLWSMADAYSTARKMNLRYMRRMQAGIVA